MREAFWNDVRLHPLSPKTFGHPDVRIAKSPSFLVKRLVSPVSSTIRDLVAHEEPLIFSKLCGFDSTLVEFPITGVGYLPKRSKPNPYTRKDEDRRHDNKSTKIRPLRNPKTDMIGCHHASEKKYECSNDPEPKHSHYDEPFSCCVHTSPLRRE